MKNKNFISFVFFSLVCFLFLLVILLKGTGDVHLLGIVFDLLYKILVDRLWGLSYISFPIIGFWINFCLYYKNKPNAKYSKNLDITTITLQCFYFFLVIFFLNILLLNFFILFDSSLAGLYPKIFHAVILNYLGESGRLTFFSLFFELSFLITSTLLLLFVFRFYWKGKIKKKEKKIISLKKVFNSLQKTLANIKEKILENKIYVLKVNDHNLDNIIDKKKVFLKIPEHQFNVLQKERQNENSTLKINRFSEEQNPIQDTLPPNSTHQSDTPPFPVLLKNNLVEQSKTLQEIPKNLLDPNTSKNPAHPKESITPKKSLQKFLDKIPLVLNNEKSNTLDNLTLKKIIANIEIIHFSKPFISDEDSDKYIQEMAQKLEKVLADFNIKAKVVEVATGPVITRYEITIEEGIRLSKITGLNDNIALSLAAKSVRIIAPIPGKSTIGIEIPNKNRKMISLRDVIDTRFFWESDNALPIALGKSIAGQGVIADLASTPHLLVAGATGSGKSVCVNSIICSLLFKLSPQEVRFLMIDPKMVELAVYNDIPHLLSPVIIDPKKAALALRWVIAEMESRYYLLEKYKVRSIQSYNEMIHKKIKQNQNLTDSLNNDADEEMLGTLPYIVVIIDEFADLMMIAKKEIEDSVSRLAAMSRAVGIHLILATQRPSVDVITGVIKANFPSRIAFQVSSQVDSRTIIDIGGAETLLGKGDMLFKSARARTPERIQATFLADEEVQNIVDDLKQKGTPQYIEDIFAVGENTDKNTSYQEVEDEYFNEAVAVVLKDQKASASYLQRKLKIGYNRAARIIELMEEKGIISPADGVKPRKILI